jgi:hypothetical protein
MNSSSLAAFGARCVFAGVLISSCPNVAKAQTEFVPWQPGRRTTSTLPREVDSERSTSSGDGVYGRFDGLFDVSLDVGAAFDGGGASGAALASVHYLFMAGVYASYVDAFDGDRETQRSAAFGVDMRPAFIPRWSNNLQLGKSLPDLVIDSISLGVGAYFRERAGGSLGDRRGLEVSLGFGIPFTTAVDGPWLGARGYLRWDDPGATSAPPAQAMALATLGWHFVAGGT